MRHINVSKCPPLLSVCLFLILLPAFWCPKIRGTPIIDHLVSYFLLHPLPRALYPVYPFYLFPTFPTSLLYIGAGRSLCSVFPSLREKRQIRYNKICWLCTRIHVIITHRSCASPAYTHPPIRTRQQFTLRRDGEHETTAAASG